MKRAIHIIIAALAGCLLLASCDKIEPDGAGNYIVFGGATGTWYDGSGVEDHSQRAYIEKYTGVRCNNCPIADEQITAAVEAYNGRLIAVAIHDSSDAFCTPIDNKSPDLRTDDGNAWSVAFGVAAAMMYPNALVSRTPQGNGWDLFSPTSAFDSRIDAVLDNEAAVAVGVEATSQEGKIVIGVDLEYLQDVDYEQTLTIFIMEDGIVATQRQPNHQPDDTNYVHNHVLRDVITDIWGVDVEADGHAGTKRHVQFDYADYKSDWVLSNCHIVAFVSNKSTKQVVNIAECEVE